jgi:hypothetical protein
VPQLRPAPIGSRLRLEAKARDSHAASPLRRKTPAGRHSRAGPCRFPWPRSLSSGMLRRPFGRRPRGEAGPARHEQKEVTTMKKLAIAGLLAAALSVTALSGQKAAAWGCASCGGGGCGDGCCSYGGCWGFGFNFSFTRCGCSTPCFHPCAFAGPCSCTPTNICDAGPVAFGGFGAADYGYPAAGYPVAPTSTGVQTVGYGYEAGYGYTAPSYWYGR